jgi:Transposase DDE domain
MKTPARQEASVMSILELFCHVDDFWQQFAPTWQCTLLLSPGKHRNRMGRMHPSEIMTILIAFHHSHYRDFKNYYLEHVQQVWHSEFPTLVSYKRFVDLIPSVLVPLTAYLPTLFGPCTGISCIDSTSLAVCKNPRIASHRVFRGLAARGKTSVGWLYGFKVHLVVSDQGELLGCACTAGNVDDRLPVPHLVQCVFGKLFGDKGYLSQPLCEQLWTERYIQLITKIRKNMKNILMHPIDKLLARKRTIIETINDQLKNISQIEHSRHHSPTNFLVHVLCGLIAYCVRSKKPSLSIDHEVLWAS